MTNHNMRFNLERVNNKFIGEMEVCSAGRAIRKRIITDTIEEALAQAKTEYDGGLEQVVAYHQASTSTAAPVVESPIVPEKPVSAAKTVLDDTVKKTGGKIAKAAPKSKRKFAAA